MGKQTNVILTGDCFSILKTIDSKSVDCVITSPPYYQMRDYQNIGQIGLEKTVDEYIRKLRDVFVQVKRVLKTQGTLFIVIQDTYSGYKDGFTDRLQTEKMVFESNNIHKRPQTRRKSLMAIPERLIISMLDIGWIYRNEIIWQKPNVMPSSAKDRFTVNFEKVLFFTKSGNYFFNQQLEKALTNDRFVRGSEAVLGNLNSGRRSGSGTQKIPLDGKRNMRSVWTIATDRNSLGHFATFPKELVGRLIDAGCPEGGLVLDPFVGIGTVPVVAKQKNINWIGIDLNPDYSDIARKRTVMAKKESGKNE